MDLIIKNVDILTMDDENPIINNGYIGILSGKISYVGSEPPVGVAKRIINGKGKLLMPGLHNTHTHLPMTAMRGFADDYNLQDWLNNHVFPAEAKHDEKTIYLSAMLGICDCIRHGTVSVKDMYFTLNQVTKAAIESGIKANISMGATAFDKSSYNFSASSEFLQMEEGLKSWHNADNGRIRLETAIHAEYTSFDSAWQEVADYSQKHGLATHVHVSETKFEHEECKKRHNGKTPTQILNEYGLFDVPATAAHCVFTESCDWDIFAQKNVSVAHNPISNLKLGSGIAPISKILDHGVNVSIGTDSVCSNNSHDMFEEIKIAALLQKGILQDPTKVNACKALQLATKNGAKSQGRGQESGIIKAGYDADIIMIDLNSPNLFPVHNLYSTVVYSARGLDVCLTMVRGKILYENGNFTTIDVEKIVHEINTYVLPKMFGFTR